MDVCFLRSLLFVVLTTQIFGDDDQVTFVSELSSKPAQKLSKYAWYASVRLHRFHIPEDAAIAHWLFSVTKGHNFHCGQHNVSIHIRWGAPPVINPLGLVFPNATQWSPCLSLTLPVTSHSSTTFNLVSPAPGDWYIAAHLPKDDGRIEQKGFPSCSYFFQPQLSIRRAVDTPILQQGFLLQQTAAPDKPARLKLYVPEFASSLLVSVANCSSREKPDNGNCSLVLRLGSSSVQQGPVTVNCSGSSCSAPLFNPPWDVWIQVVVESNQENQTVSFSIVSNYTVGCKPTSVGLKADDDISFGNSSFTTSTSLGNGSVVSNALTIGNKSTSALTPLLPSACVWSIPVLYEEVDVLSLRFTAVNGPNVSVTNTHPTLLTYPLQAQATGGTLNLQLLLNTTNVTLGNSSNIVACLSPWAPVLKLNDSQPCRTALFGGYRVQVNTSSPKAMVRLPFPQSATWYLTLQITCNSSDCGNTSVVSIIPEVFVSGCVDDCGTYGECRLLRSYTYLYAACVCKAVAIYRLYIAEASVYLFTMFFSTFYHACDQPGVAVLCIMNYNTLQYCDFLGSVCSFWVTILCMARIKDTFKYSLFMLGALLIAMSMQLDRAGLWNMLGPILCGLLFMVTTWVYRGVQRRHCYPPSWKRWVLYLIPGAICALTGVCLYIFAETEENYFYTHSLWHILVASCVVFMLPPKEKNMEASGWSRGWSIGWRPRVCGYTLCQSGKDELYTVT
ncbi:post-GPI attachment to proteins factor 6 isoform X2 [Betta splendens]|uniref:Post-GPI attachment to proteins factor 6 isoform X2 n=1 Tax=Betta splendens TaxID=158456 RepID=A0A6P7L1F4_BETSP|nr:post-GPI attachment to proteins factor 6 isoform X2 [Betta splendens]